MRIPGLRGLSLRTLAARTAREFLRDDMATYAAALAYHLLFAVFPFLLFLLSLLSFFNVEALFAGLLAQAERALPAQALAQVQSVIAEVSGKRGGLLSLGALFSVWFASLGMRSVMNALNKAYDLEEGRPWWKRYGLSLFYTIAFALLVVLATTLMLVGPALVASWAERIGLGEEVLLAWRWLRIPAAMLLAMLAAALVYHFAPNLEQRFRMTTPGSVVAVLLWVLVSWGFRLYVANFGRYSIIYGSVGAVIVLLLYFFLSALVLLLGGEINAIVQRHSPRGEHPRERPEPSP